MGNGVVLAPEKSRHHQPSPSSRRHTQHNEIKRRKNRERERETREKKWHGTEGASGKPQRAPTLITCQFQKELQPNNETKMENHYTFRGYAAVGR